MRHRWFELSHGRCVIIAEQRARRGVKSPPRFLVLGALKGPKSRRPTVCSGELRDDGWKLNHGVIAEELLAEVLAAFQQFRTRRAS